MLFVRVLHMQTFLLSSHNHEPQTSTRQRRRQQFEQKATRRSTFASSFSCCLQAVRQRTPLHLRFSAARRSLCRGSAVKELVLCCSIRRSCVGWRRLHRSQHHVPRAVLRRPPPPPSLSSLASSRSGAPCHAVQGRAHSIELRTALAATLAESSHPPSSTPVASARAPLPT